MSNDLVVVPPPELPATASSSDIVNAWLSDQKPSTVEAYKFDLSDFSRFVNAPTAGAAVELLISGGPALANRKALDYKADMMARKPKALAPSTIARRLSALRSLLRLCRMLGRITWSIDVRGPKVTQYRDTRGPGLKGWRKIRAKAPERTKGDPDGRTALRNTALVSLMHDLGIRRGEALAMDRSDVDFEARDGVGEIHIIGKGKTEPEPLSLGSEPARNALRAWVEARGNEPGPLFCRLDRAAGDGDLQRLSGDAVCRMVRRLGVRAGITGRVRPHGLRHQAITRLIELEGAHKAKKFSRHVKFDTLLRYDDNREDIAGEMSKRLGEDG